MLRRILVTGASGFIGANLVRKLLAEGQQVHALVRPQSNLWRLKGVESEIEIHTDNLLDFDALLALVQRTKPEVIFHLAFPPGHPASLAEKKEMVEAGILGTVHLLEAATRAGCERLIYAGSSTEYGSRAEPLREDQSLRPSTFRGFAKGAGTLACLFYAQAASLPLLILRLTSVYGYWEAAKRFVPSAILAGLLHRPFSLTRPGFMHDHIFVEDVLAACWKSVETPFTTPEILNIGSGIQQPNEAVIELVQEVLGEEILVTQSEHPPSPADTTFWQADIALARARIGWHPEYSLKAGLIQTIAWFKNHLTLYA